MNIFFARDLAAKLELDGITNVKTVSLHPGLVRTEIFKLDERGCLVKWCICCLCSPCILLCSKSPRHGAQTSLFCCLSDFKSLKNGAFYDACAIEKVEFKGDYEGQQKAVWDFSENATKEYFIA